ncbi:hypothetical protein N2W54_000739 [Lotmaria passim]
MPLESLRKGKQQFRQLLQILEDEAQLQRQLCEQHCLLQHISEASLRVSAWWREEAAAAAAAHPTDFTDAVSPALHPLQMYPGMFFYSLGELLQLTAAPDPPGSAGGLPLRITSEAAVCYRDTASFLPPPPHAAAPTPPRPPFTGIPAWAFVSTVLQPTSGDRLPTPALLIRYRLLDPAETALPPTHTLLLGSVTPDEFPALMKWLHSLTVECDEALQRLRPDSSLSITASQDESCSIARGLLSDYAFKAKEEEGSPTRLNNELVMLPSQQSLRWDTPIQKSGTVAKRPRVADGDNDTTAAKSDSAAPWDPLPWLSLCASLHRLLTFLCEVAQPPPQEASTPEASQAAVESWEHCWAAWGAERQNRAQHRFLLATLRSMCASLWAVFQWGTAQQQQRDRESGSDHDLFFPQRKQRRDVWVTPSVPSTPEAHETCVVSATSVCALRRLAELCSTSTKLLGRQFSAPIV